MNLTQVNLDFNYSDFGPSDKATGYERLLYDAMTGDTTLFHRADTVEAAWRIATPILDVWGSIPPRDFPNYAAGAWGPPASDELMKRDGRAWRNALSGTGDAERKRLVEDARREKNWKRWGPYSPERQWGTVREDYSSARGLLELLPSRSRAEPRLPVGRGRLARHHRSRMPAVLCARASGTERTRSSRSASSD